GVVILVALPQILFAQERVTCASKIGERQSCPADTSNGVILAKSSGESACLLGKTWGYDDRSIWVADGCVGEFVVKGLLEKPQEKKRKPEYIPNAGFLLYEGEKGEIYMRLF